MSKFVRGVLIGLGILLAIALLAALAFQVYGMVTLNPYGRFHEMIPMMRGFGQFGHGFGFGWFPFGGLFGLLILAGLAVLVVAALVGTSKPQAARRACSNCGKPLEPEWVNCPYCGQKV